MSYALSVLIPARNETCYDIDLLAETVTNVLANSSDATEIVVVLDGYSPTSVVRHPRVTYVHHARSIGQRAATNEAARISRAKYVMKLDAHCALSEGFDVKLMDGFQPEWTMCPAQYNLIAFNWKCKKCGWQRDQGPKPAQCGQCGSQYLKQVKLWFPRDGRENSNGAGGRRNAYLSSWRFDSKLEYQQWGALSHRYTDPIHDTMSLLGACWMIERERYYKLDICDERYGSWGQQGTEIACKTWLSGGELKVNTNAWFAHFFRVGGLHFPYEGGGRKERAMARCREMWLGNKWEQQVHPLSWLIERFSPVPDWNDDNPVWQQVKAAGAEFSKQQAPAVITHKPTKSALYYSCLSHDPTLELAARANLKRATNGHEIGVVTLNQRIDFGDWNVVVQREKSGTTMHYQILAGLERSRADYVFLCESDVFYHPSHFDFTPSDDNTFYYNTNVWRIRYSDGHAVRTDGLQQVSGICASRKLLLAHYRKRVAMIEANGGVFDVKRMAYEPGTRGRFGDERIANWESPYPNIDITGHGQTLTTPHFSIDSFRNKRFAQGWQETDSEIPGWGKLSGRLQQFLADLAGISL